VTDTTDSAEDSLPELLAREIVLEPIDSLRDHPENPNEGDPEAIGESAEKVGFYNVVFAQKSTRMILAGHSRRDYLRAAGSHVAPVVWLDVDDEAALRILVGDNEIPREHSRRNDQRLTRALASLLTTEDNLAGTGFDDDSYARILADLTAPERFGPVTSNPRLDQVETDPTICPNCGHSWTPATSS